MEAQMNKKLKAAVSHHDHEVAELRADRELAVESAPKSSHSRQSLCPSRMGTQQQSRQ